MTEKLLQGAPAGQPVDWNADGIFILRYQALSKAQAYMTGQAFADAEKWLKANEDRYVKLNTNNKP